ncbi:MAG: hypothetical protein HC896_09100 [Bacteroidales bacterium]|nr:hypothetical protein [Bacteroidales bacterium]
MPFTGFINTSSQSHKITDSGAGGTAFSIGKRSYNGSIGVAPDTLPAENITEMLSKKGYNTGVVSTSSVTHATPACFYAHVKLRKMEEEIARQLVHSDIDFLRGEAQGFCAKKRRVQLFRFFTI